MGFFFLPNHFHDFGCNVTIWDINFAENDVALARGIFFEGQECPGADGRHLRAPLRIYDGSDDVSAECWADLIQYIFIRSTRLIIREIANVEVRAIRS